MELKTIQDLIRKYNAGQASAREREAVELWYENVRLSTPEEEANVLTGDVEAQLRKQLKCTTDRNRSASVRQLSWRLWAAVFLLFALVGAAYMTLHEPKHAALDKQLAEDISVRIKDDVAPGVEKATLTLNTGEQIVLDNFPQAKISTEEGTIIGEVTEGVFTYISDQLSPEASGYNTLATARGGRYRMVLPDGSQVWLNAASSLKYPVRFDHQAERKVFLEGEAYFEVAPNAKQPFIVNVNHMRVEVLGTHFNVSGYKDDEQIKTTLLEGAVKISLTNKDETEATRILKPGQQAIAGKGDQRINVQPVNAEHVIAWKNNFFRFDGTDVETIMREIARWYDVEVLFIGPLPDVRFTGIIPREEMVSSVLEILELSGGVKFMLSDGLISVYAVPQEEPQ